jgi:WD40 repeat protein
MIRIIATLVFLCFAFLIANSQSVNLEIIRGLSTDRRLLSTNGDGSVVDLWRADESGRQKWILEPHNGPRGTYYNIIVSGDVSGARRYLSANGDGSTVDLWSADDGSGRQQWIIYRDPMATTVVIGVAGGVKGPRLFLSCSTDGGKVDLWTQDDGSGRQRWLIKELASVLVQPVVVQLIVVEPVVVQPAAPAGLPTNMKVNFSAQRGGTVEYLSVRYDNQLQFLGNLTLWPGAKIYVYPQHVADADVNGISFDPKNPAIGGKTFIVRAMNGRNLEFTENIPMMRNTNNDYFRLVIEVFR